MGNYFVSVIGSKIGVIKGYVGGTLIVIEVGEIYVVALGQEDVMCDNKEPVKVWWGGAGATVIMECWTMEGYDIGFLIGVGAVVVRSLLWDYK